MPCMLPTEWAVFLQFKLTSLVELFLVLFGEVIDMFTFGTFEFRQALLGHMYNE